MNPDKSPYVGAPPPDVRKPGDVELDTAGGRGIVQVLARDRLGAYLDKRFEVSKRGSTVGTEVKAGFISWMTMSYIMVVNPVILANARSRANPLPLAPLMGATAMSSFLGSLLVGLWANMPLGLMPGMGLNAYFVFGICHNFDVTLAQALSCGFMSGLLLLVLSQLGVCHWLVKTILSQHLKNAITVSIGMFQAMIGFQIMGLVVGSPDTLVTLGDLSFSNTKLYVSMTGFCLVAIMSCQEVHGALLIGIWQIAICSWIMGICNPPEGMFLMPRFDLAFTVDFSLWMPGNEKLYGMIVGTSVLFFVALFDLAGVQYGLIQMAKLLTVKDKEQVVAESTEIFSSAALSTMLGACLGTSPLIIANESSAGIVEGAKTGLSSLVIAILFFVSAFISPLLAAIPHLATAAPLVLIGAFMMGPIASIRWSELDQCLPSFITCTVVPFTYSIHTGIIAGILMDTILHGITWIRLGCSRVRKNHKADSGLETPERVATPIMMEIDPDMQRPPDITMTCVGSGRSTPLIGRRTHGSGRSTPQGMRRDGSRLSLQSPHTHRLTLPGADDNDDKVEKFLGDLNDWRTTQGAVPASCEPRDHLLLQALQNLEDYLEVRQ